MDVQVRAGTNPLLITLLSIGPTKSQVPSAPKTVAICSISCPTVAEICFPTPSQKLARFRIISGLEANGDAKVPARKSAHRAIQRHITDARRKQKTPRTVTGLGV